MYIAKYCFSINRKYVPMSSIVCTNSQMTTSISSCHRFGKTKCSNSLAYFLHAKSVALAIRDLCVCACVQCFLRSLSYLSGTFSLSSLCRSLALSFFSLSSARTCTQVPLSCPSEFFFFFVLQKLLCLVLCCSHGIEK